MAQPKRHHHIAQGIQRRFTDAEGLLHAFDKRRPERGVFATTPLNLFVEKDLYTIRRKDGSRNTDLEHWYSELEGAVTPLLDHIIESCLAGQEPGLPADAKQLWDTFFYHQQKRAPDVFVRLGLEEQFYKDLPGRMEDYEREHGPLTDEDRLHMADPAVLSRMLIRSLERKIRNTLDGQGLAPSTRFPASARGLRTEICTVRWESSTP
ncbi:DUF4238 domain-containing protein [Hyphomicrobium sp.]|uniref:DUF4238 domain-containing protein n=1 Tax=Hyphomicrobium sp. TaxID=82 RepID=UPI002FDF9EC3